jgi:anti-sigma factor RsiW
VLCVTVEEATMLSFVRRLLLRLAIAAILGATVALVAAVPVRAAQDALGSGAWDLARYFTGRLAPPEVASPVLPLVVAGIVVLAAMSSSRRRNDDGW